MKEKSDDQMLLDPDARLRVNRFIGQLHCLLSMSLDQRQRRLASLLILIYADKNKPMAAVHYQDFLRRLEEAVELSGIPFSIAADHGGLASKELLYQVFMNTCLAEKCRYEHGEELDPYDLAEDLAPEE